MLNSYTSHSSLNTKISLKTSECPSEEKDELNDELKLLFAQIGDVSA